MFDIYDESDEIVSSKVLTLLDQQPELVLAQDHLGNTLLHEVVSTPYARLVDEVLRRGADVNATNNKGQTPLHAWAEDWHNSALVGELLIKHGALLDVKDSVGRTPLAILAKGNGEGKADAVTLLREYGAMLDLNTALWLGECHFVSTQVKQQPEIFRLGHGPLLPFPKDIVADAVVADSAEMINLLLDHGADVNAVAYGTYSPLEIAMRDSGKWHLVELLLQRGASSNNNTLHLEFISFAKQVGVDDAHIEQWRQWA
jgi:ankyrin repeat protein